jgi:hypothetical protein
MALVDFLEAENVFDRPKRFQEIMGCGLPDYGMWLGDQLRIQAPRDPIAATRIATVMCQCLPDQSFWFQCDLAEGLAMAGQTLQALQRTDALLRAWPDYTWSLIHAGDVHEILGLLDHARRFWEDALTLAEDSNDWHAAYQRLRDVAPKLGREQDLAELRAEFPAPGPTATDKRAVVSKSIPETLASRSDPVAVLPRGVKVGRNDPCPCGSGKKYKKCCLLSE